MAAALVGLGAAPASAALTYGKLQSTSTGYCLDGNDDGNIYPKACNAGNYQQWAFEAKGGGVYQLKQRATLHCLDAYADGKVRLALCNGGAYQEFTFDYNSYGNRIRSKKWNKCLDGNNATAPAIYTLTCNTGNYQRWHR
ncbi:RICIN domain-containing protein [Streptomyces sp. NPDC001930]|uniref:RICIN domain-containing protein n=1 Tax=Streptomyces sp. NPDC001930 TaxID=3364625 RepID=UPI0036739D9D